MIPDPAAMQDFRDQQRYDAHQEALRNARRAKQRSNARRHLRRRRLIALGVLLVPIAVAVFAFTWGSTETAAPDATTSTPEGTAPTAADVSAAERATGGRVAPPDLMRGVHLTSYAIAEPSLFDPVLAIAEPKLGLNTLQIDIKDERGEVAFETPIPLAQRSGAARPIYDPVEVIREAHMKGLYVVGRIVTFQDGYAPRANPKLGLKTPDGELWQNDIGITWLDPSNRAAWDYPIQLALYAAELGFDEIMFDYVRYPTDGDTDALVFDDPGAPRDKTITDFLKRAKRELGPRNVQVSAAFFGLAASENLGIGQNPARVRNVLDAVYPMVYPSHFYSGQFNISDPNANPGDTIAAALADWRRRMNGGSAVIRPWLQDFSYGNTTYDYGEVRAQIDAADATGAAGWLLWNADCVYTLEVFRSSPAR
jgi:hypothetical protein